MSHPLLRLAVCALVALPLAGCGSKGDTGGGFATFLAAAKAVVKGGKGGGSVPLTRDQLAAFKAPMLQVDLPSRGMIVYVVPVAASNGVETWFSATDQSISFRDGIMVATRGFGADLMRAEVPSIVRISQGSGTVSRKHTYLDGADRVQVLEFTCALSVSGPETITVVERQHSTRHVLEECTGKAGKFTNEYWFEGGNFLRQSKQLLVPGEAPLTLSQVIG